MVVVSTRRRALALGLTLALLAALVACTPDEPAAAPVRTTVEQIWTTAGLEPVSAVRNIGGVAVVYGTTPGGLVLYGLDPATGAQLWSKPAAMPTADATSVGVREIAGSVAYFRSTGIPRMNQLVLADPRTGTDRTATPPRYWSGYSPTCESDQSVACLSAWVNTPDGWTSQTLRVDPASGVTAPVSSSTANAPDDSTPLINGLYYSFLDNPGDATDASSDDREISIGRWVDGASAWTKRATELFGPALPQPRQLWMSKPQDRDYATITAVGSGLGIVSPTLDLAKDIATNAYSLSDGSTRWKREGAWMGCGDDPFVDRAAEPGDVISDEYLCQYTGSALVSSNIRDDSRLTTTNLTVTMERIDPATGEVRWSSAMGDAKPLAGDTSGPLESALLDDNHLFEPNSAGGLVVDLETGETRAPLPEDIFWCQTDGTFPLTTPVFDHSTPVTDGEKFNIVRPCRSTGEDASLPTVRMPSSVAASFDGDIQVVALAAGVTGFVVPPLPSGNEFLKYIHDDKLIPWKYTVKSSGAGGGTGIHRAGVGDVRFRGEDDPGDRRWDCRALCLGRQRSVPDRARSGNRGGAMAATRQCRGVPSRHRGEGCPSR